jgi:pyruvoyl-dependent arginine decarboxylase (PvlArgDC)
MAKVAGKKAPGKSSVGTVSEYAKQAEQNAARKEIQARMAKKAAASTGKKTVKKKIISNKKLAGTTGASTMMLSGDSVKKR